jgi:Flp pilus assembly pilin Flp
MYKILTTFLRLRIWRDEHGQDLVEYALLAGLAAVASGLFVPDMSASMTTIYSRVASKLVQAAS